MPDLPKVSQQFDADVTPYVSGIENMIASVDRFLTKNQDAIDSVRELDDALRNIPNVVVVDIQIRQSGSTNVHVDNLTTLGDTASNAGNAYDNLSENMDEYAEAAMRAAHAEALAANAASSNEEAMRRLETAGNALLGVTGEYDAALEREMELAGEVDGKFHELGNTMFTMTAAETAMRDATLGAMMASGELSDMADVMALKMGVAGDLARAEAEMIRMLEAELGEGTRSTDVFTESMDRAAGHAIIMARSEKLLADTSNVLDDDLMAAAQAAEESGNAARSGYGWWRIFTKEITLWAGLMGDNHLTGKVQLWHPIIDGLIEATIAFSEAAIGLGIAFATMAPAGQDVYEHLKSVAEVSHALNIDIPPLSGSFHALTKSLAPNVLEIYGGLLNTINGNGSVLAQTAHALAGGFDDWIAKLDLFFQKQGQGGGLIQGSVGILQQFAQILDNVGVALDNFLKADPGTVHFLLDFVEGATKLLDVLTSMPSWILKTALAFHAIDLWGGLAATGIVRMISPLESLLSKMAGVSAVSVRLGEAGEEAGGFSKLKAVFLGLGDEIALIGGKVDKWATGMVSAFKEAEGGASGLKAAFNSGFGGMGEQIGKVLEMLGPYGAVLGVIGGVAIAAYIAQENLNRATKEWVDGMQAAIAKASGFQQITDTYQDLEKVQSAFSQSTDQTNKMIKDQGTVAAGAESRFVQNYNPALDAAASKQDILRGSLHQLSSEQMNITGNISYLSSKYKIDYSEAVELAAQAGVNLTQSMKGNSEEAELARQKVANLVAGYKGMAEQGGQLSNAVNAVTLSAEMQNSKISTLTQAYSNFVSLVTSSDSAFLTAATDMQGMAAAANNTDSTLKTTGGSAESYMKTSGDMNTTLKQGTVSMNGLSTASLQLQQSFVQTVNDGSSLINSLYTQASAAGMGQKGMNMVTQAGKDYVAQLLPMSKGSTTATAELYALAQTAGYTGADSFEALSKWVGNTHDPMNNLNGIMTTMTKSASNLTTDVMNLSNAVGQDLNSAMAQSVVQANGGETAFKNFATGIATGTTTSKTFTTAAEDVIQDLERQTGSVPKARTEFEAYGRQLDLSKQKSDALWSEIVNKMDPALKTIPHPGTIPIRMSGTGSYTIGAGHTVYTSSGEIGGLGGHTKAAGGYVHGGTGPTADDVPIRASGGEYVVKADSVSKYGTGMMDIINAGRFADGGVVTGNQQVDNGTWAAKTYEPAFIKSMAAAMAASMKSSIASAEKAAESLGMVHPTGSGATVMALMESMAASIGWTGDQLAALLSVESREAGFNLTAKNPTSDAYGLAQFIDGPSEYAQYGGNVNTAAGQITAMFNYIRQRYGTPEAAAAHETNFGWYDQGGMLNPGMTMAYNGTGQPEKITKPYGGSNEGGVVHSVVNLDGKQIFESMKPYVYQYNARNSGNGNVNGVWRPR